MELTIVAFDVPYPPNYGGVIDVFYKIKALKKYGVKIHLHCFDYGKGEQPELNKNCESVTYYKRHLGKHLLLSSTPFVVKSRQNKELLNNLLKVKTPILLEGLHSCGYLEELKANKKTIWVRTHNIEHDYYNGLASVEKNIFKKQFFISEAKKLKQYEDILKKADQILAISPKDTAYLQQKQNKNTTYLPAFHTSEEVSSNTGNGEYCLYHGNLSVGENNKAACWLIENVFSENNIPFVIAGSNPQKQLVDLCKLHSNVTLLENITVEELDQQIENAQVNVLPTFQATGIKLKLLSALYKGRFCVVNKEMIENTGLENACTIGESAEELTELIQEKFKQSFTAEHIDKRRNVLTKFSNLHNAEIVMELLKKILNNC